jgi:phosphate starvation-inducible membrane PsiE
MNARPDGKSTLETAGYWLTLASLIAMIIGVHYGQMGILLPCLATLVVGIALNVIGENRASRGTGR